jgi:hypothetical protein
MKLQEYINSGESVLNQSNIWTIAKYESIIKYLASAFPQKYSQINYTPEAIHHGNILSDLAKYNNKTLLVSNLDIDFPPPKPPYEYDAFFDIKKLPQNYEEIPYINKIQNDVTNVLEQNHTHVFAHAVSIDHPLIQMVPAGIFSRFNHFHLKTNPKTILCYANFGLSCDRWFGNPRNTVLHDIQSIQFIIKENIISTEVARRDHMNFNHFYQQISQSKFSICPRGCGIDTYRLWDCICLGCIPIVEKYGGYERFTDLPILFVDSFTDYGKLTEDYLQQKYDEMMTRKYNYSMLTVDYWVKSLTA